MFPEVLSEGGENGGVISVMTEKLPDFKASVYVLNQNIFKLRLFPYQCLDRSPLYNLEFYVDKYRVLAINLNVNFE